MGGRGTHHQGAGGRLGDNNAIDRVLCDRLGFDFGWGAVFGPLLGLQPGFRRRVVACFPDGSRHVLDLDGAIVLEKPDIVSIPSEIDHLLKGRAEWERIFRPRLRYSDRRLVRAKVNTDGRTLRFDCGRAGVPAGRGADIPARPVVRQPVRRHPQLAGRRRTELPHRGRPGAAGGDDRDGGRARSIRARPRRWQRASPSTTATSGRTSASRMARW